MMNLLTWIVQRIIFCSIGAFHNFGVVDASTPSLNLKKRSIVIDH